MDGEKLDLIWGAQKIADELGLELEQGYYLFEKGAIASVKKVAGRWCADRRALRAEFRKQVARPPDAA